MFTHAKKYVFFLLLMVALLLKGQNSHLILGEQISNKTYSINQVLSGTCGSPDGTMLSTSSTPSGYNWLNSNGYCFPITYTKNFTMCFNFTSTGTSIDINSGYSSLGCSTISFSGLNLYKCNPSCSYVGTGTSFVGLTIGQCYTWCFSGSCSGFGASGFNSICPYWQNVTVLPIELLYFLGTKQENINRLFWSTKTETNNKEFIVQKSLNGTIWNDLAIMQGAGTTQETQSYVYNDFNHVNGVNYYRLIQIDHNGNKSFLNIISINNTDNNVKLLKITNILGQELNINENNSGILFYYWNDGTITKEVK